MEKKKKREKTITGRKEKGERDCGKIVMRERERG